MESFMLFMHVVTTSVLLEKKRIPQRFLRHKLTRIKVEWMCKWMNKCKRVWLKICQSICTEGSLVLGMNFGTYEFKNLSQIYRDSWICDWTHGFKHIMRVKNGYKRYKVDLVKCLHLLDEWNYSCIFWCNIILLE